MRPDPFDRDDDVGTVPMPLVVAIVVSAVLVAMLFGALLLSDRDAAPVPDRRPAAPRVEFGTVVVVVDGVEVPSSCDGFGHRVYLTPESSYRERSITVVDDPSCVEAAG